MGKRDEYIEKTKQRLDELNAEMADLEARIDKTVGEARQKQAEMLDKLREQSSEAQQKLKRLRDAGEDSWDSIKAEVEHVRKTLVQSFNYFKSQL